DPRILSRLRLRAQRAEISTTRYVERLQSFPPDQSDRTGLCSMRGQTTTIVETQKPTACQRGGSRAVRRLRSMSTRQTRRTSDPPRAPAELRFLAANPQEHQQFQIGSEPRNLS